MSAQASDQRKSSSILGLRLIDRIIMSPVMLFMALCLSLFLNILIEWLGMALDWWDLPGSQHSLSMLETELAWLNTDFRDALGKPIQLAKTLASDLHTALFVWQGQDVTASLPHDRSLLGEYALAAIVSVQLFSVRMAILVLSLPVFLVFAVVAMVDGLVQRELRRWGGANEQGYVYHHVKRLIGPMIWLPLIIYLSLPTSMHPNWIVMPFAALFALTVWVTAQTFKQYL